MCLFNCPVIKRIWVYLEKNPFEKLMTNFKFITSINSDIVECGTNVFLYASGIVHSQQVRGFSKASQEGHQDDSVGNGACCQTWPPRITW